MTMTKYTWDIRRWGIVGSRTCTSPKQVFPVLYRILRPGDIIISGGAKGADSLAEQYATEKNYTIVVYPAMWKIHGRAAGPIRNQKIVDDCDEIIAFWDGKSSGTRSTLKLAKEAGKPVHIFWI